MNKLSAKSLFAAAIAASLLGVTTIARADVSQEDALRFVKVCDSNKDAMVSKAELMKRVNDMMPKLTTDKDGMVDSAKALAFIFELQKTDGATSAMISKADLMKRIDTAFTKMDTKGAGMLDQKQLAAFLTELMKSGG